MELHLPMLFHPLQFLTKLTEEKFLSHMFLTQLDNSRLSLISPHTLMVNMSQLRESQHLTDMKPTHTQVRLLLLPAEESHLTLLRLHQTVEKRLSLNPHTLPQKEELSLTFMKLPFSEELNLLLNKL
jgi:hypothetical protein